MPHVIIKMWPGKSEQQKTRMTEAVTKAVMASLGYGEESVSVGIEEVEPGEWSSEGLQARNPWCPGQALQEARVQPSLNQSEPDRRRSSQQRGDTSGRPSYPCAAQGS